MYKQPSFSQLSFQKKGRYNKSVTKGRGFPSHYQRNT